MIKPSISIVLGSYNRRNFLKATIDSVGKNAIEVPYEIIVVDGGSTDGAANWLFKQKDVITIVQHNRGSFRGKPIERRSWGYFMNLGFKCAQGKYILMISDDCLLVPGSVMNGFNLFEKLIAQGRDIGALAFYWRNWPTERKYRVGLTLGDKMFVNHGMYLRKAVKEVGWIDETGYRFYHADGDLCLKLWERGYETTDCPNAFVEHFQHANQKLRKSNYNMARCDKQAYLNRWSGMFYDERLKNFGGWRFIEYTDQSHTARNFPWTAVTKLKLQDLSRRLILKFYHWIITKRLAAPLVRVCVKIAVKLGL